MTAVSGTASTIPVSPHTEPQIITESSTAILEDGEQTEDGQPLGIATRLVQSAFAGAKSSSQLSFEEFRRWIVETQLFLVVWQNVFDPYEASGFRSPMEVPVFVPQLREAQFG